MFKQRKSLLWLPVCVLISLVIAACQPQVETVEVTRVVESTVVETVTVEGEPVEVTRVVTETVVETVTVEVPVEEETAPTEFTAPDNTTFRNITYGDIDTLDPALAYDTASAQVIQNVMEPLIYYNHTDPNSYVPVLAEEVPNLENGLISEDGQTYTFHIREGITFHNGSTLEPHDVAYSFQRGLLQSDPNGPQWLLLEPILGYSNCFDISEGIQPDCSLAGDKETLLAGATVEQLLEVCTTVQNAIVADDAAGTRDHE